MLPLPRLSFFAPLVFTTNGILRSTETNSANNEPIIRIPSGETVILSCAPNHFKFHPTASVQATCKSGQTLGECLRCVCVLNWWDTNSTHSQTHFTRAVINDHEHHFRKGLNCEVRAIEEILQPVRGCDTGATARLTATEYGFTNPVTNRSYVLGEACYDERLGRTTFVHTTYRSDYKNFDLDRVALRIVDATEAGYFRQSHPASRYKIDYLKATRIDTLNDRLTATFGFRQAPQLQPHRFVGEELLLNYQFSNVLKLGWNYMMVSADLVVDRLAAVADDLKAKLAHEGVADVYVGTHGVLRIMDQTGANTEVYLTDGRFPVAKFIWMVAVTRQSNKAVAYVVPNGMGQSAAELCPNRCVVASVGGQVEATTVGPGVAKTETLSSSARDAGGNGQQSVHCCEYKDLQAQVMEMPSLDGTFTML